MNMMPKAIIKRTGLARIILRPKGPISQLPATAPQVKHTITK